MAGNIIAAIASTNAIIAAMIVLEGIKVLEGRLDDCVGTCRRCLLCIYMPVIDRSLSDCRYVPHTEASRAAFKCIPQLPAVDGTE